MNFTKEQMGSAARGEPVEIHDEGTEYVLIRKDVYDQLSQPEGELDPRDTYPAVLKAWDSAGSDDDATAYRDLS